jgi:hypothetical protein
MGTIASPWRYDAVARRALQPHNPGCPAIFRYASWANAASAFPILDGAIEFGDKLCQVCRSPQTGFAQTLKNAYPFGTRGRTGIRESGA